MENLSIIHDELCALCWCCVQVDIRKGLVYFGCEDAIQLLEDALLMLEDLFTDLLLLVYLYSFGNAVHYVDYEAQAERIQGEVTSRYVLCFYLLQFNCAAQDDQLITDRIIVLEELVYLDSYLLGYKGIELCYMQIILYNLHQQKQSLRNFIHLILHDNLISNNPKIANNFITIIHDTLLLQTINKYA